MRQAAESDKARGGFGCLIGPDPQDLSGDIFRICAPLLSISIILDDCAGVFLLRTKPTVPGSYTPTPTDARR